MSATSGNRESCDVDLKQHPLPQGWDMYIDKLTGLPFFAEHTTRSTTWQDPRQRCQHRSQGNGQVSVREIPIIRTTDPADHGDYFVSGNHRHSASVRDIPIHRESSGAERVPSGNTKSYPSLWSTDVPRSTVASDEMPIMIDVKHQNFGELQHLSDQRYHSECARNDEQEGVMSEQRGNVRQIPIVLEPAAEMKASDGRFEQQSSSCSTSVQAVEEADTLQVEPPAKRGRSPSPAPENMTALEVIDKILSECAKMRTDVERFCGQRGDKQYLLLEEMLTRLLIKLDRVDSEGRDDIRNARREAVRSVQSALDLLETRVSAHNSVSVSDNCNDSSQQEDCDNDGLKVAAKVADSSSVREMVLSSEVQC